MDLFNSNEACQCNYNNSLSVHGMLPYLLYDISDDIRIFDCPESTNQTAKEPAYSSAKHGTIIIAETQTAGKGRYGKSFHSPPDCGLYITFILNPENMTFSTPTLITAFAAVAVCETIEAITDKSPKIKWVNDIFLADKKICGILTESVNTQENKRQIILGIGININDPSEGFPDELKTTAGSIFGTDKPSITRNNLAAELINRILFSSDLYDEKIMLAKYKYRMFLLGKVITVNETKSSYKATVLDVDGHGHLIVKTFENKIMSLSTGEVSIEK